MKRLLSVIVTILFILFSVAVYSGTDLELSTNEKVLGPFVQFQDLDGLESDIEKLPDAFFKKNRDVIPNGFALANTLGYPNGKSTIKQFPHFEFGVAVGASAYKYDRYEDFDLDDDNPIIPGGWVNGGFHFGTGISENVDLSVKFFSIGWFSSLYEDELERKKEFSNKTVDGRASVDVQSFGIKARYNLVKESSPYNILFNFGGISVNLAFDYMKCNVKVDGVYSQLENTELSLKDPFSSYSSTNPVEANATLEGDFKFENSYYSLTPEIFAYFDLLYFITFYTGPSISLVIGTSDLVASFNGDVVNNSDVVLESKVVQDQVIPAGSNIASATFRSDNIMDPMRFIPKWTAGFEINLWVLKVTGEVATLMTRVSDMDSFSAQAGVRFDL